MIDDAFAYKLILKSCSSLRVWRTGFIPNHEARMMSINISNKERLLDFGNGLISTNDQ